MIRLQHPLDNEAQPAVAGTTTTVASSRALRHSQAHQLRRRRSTHTQPRNVQPRDVVARDDAVELVVAQRQMTITLPWPFFASLLMTILLCIHYSYFASTISPLATARQSLATMAGIPEGFTMLPEGQEPVFSGVTIGNGAVVNI
eukprot:1345326-Amphidinium_carterae.1